MVLIGTDIGFKWKQGSSSSGRTSVAMSSRCVRRRVWRSEKETREKRGVGGAARPQSSLSLRHTTGGRSGGEGLDVGKNASARFALASLALEVLV